LPGRTGKLLGRHRDGLVLQLDADPVGMRGEVAVPGRVLRRPARRRDDQPGPVAVGEPREGSDPLLPALAPDGGQDQQVHPLELPAAAVLPHHQLLDPAADRAREGGRPRAARARPRVEGHKPLQGNVLCSTVVLTSVILTRIAETNKVFVTERRWPSPDRPSSCGSGGTSTSWTRWSARS